MDYGKGLWKIKIVGTNLGSDAEPFVEEFSINFEDKADALDTLGLNMFSMLQKASVVIVIKWRKR